MLNLADLNPWYDRIHQMGIWKPEKPLYEIILASVLTKSKFYSFFSTFLLLFFFFLNSLSEDQKEFSIFTFAL